MSDWSAWLAQIDDAESLKTLRLHADKGLPCGDDGFVAKLGGMAGRSLAPKPCGRPSKIKGSVPFFNADKMTAHFQSLNFHCEGVVPTVTSMPKHPISPVYQSRVAIIFEAI